jgi:hypothetical protein
MAADPAGMCDRTGSVAAERSHLVERAERIRAEVLTVGAALAVMVASIALAARVLLHERAAPSQSPAAVRAGTAARPSAGAASLLFGDPHVLALAQRSGDVLFGVAAAPSGAVEVLVRTGDAKPLTLRALGARASSPVPLRPVPCGEGCFRLAAGALQGVPVQLELSVSRPGEPVAMARFALPAELPGSGDALYARVRSVMNGLRSVHVSETLTAGLGPVVRTEYDLEAPDRIRFETSEGQRVVIVGKRRFDFERDRWVESPFPETRSPAFIWQGASRPRLLGSATLGGERVRVLALYLPRRSFPVWFRLYVRADGRVLEAEMLGPSHFMVDRFSRFGEPVSITVPR